ncbi:MAG: ribonuclease HII [Flavobacteriales bacterium]|nr:ribonuclease HII [Flavobacteriales bacterium]
MKGESGLSLFQVSGRLEAGVDEAGRGCLAGPVTAAAVIPGSKAEGWLALGLDDSKKLGPEARSELRLCIEAEAEAWAVGWASVQEIEEINILQATYLAMHRAIDGLGVKPDHLLIDGNRFKPHNTPHSCEIKGDGRFLSIAAASILAKTHRDARMMALAEAHPQYGWDGNKGYPTPSHKAAILKWGHTRHHRRTFRGVQGTLFG